MKKEPNMTDSQDKNTDSVTLNVYPAILTDSVQEAQQQIMAIASIPKIRTVQVDVIDGFFVENVTITPSDLPEVDFGELSCDLHLMTEEPLDFVYEALDNKDEIPVRAVIGQVERMSKQVDFLKKVKAEGWVPGLSLDVYTPLNYIEEEAWEQLEVVQLMGIEAGYQGQSFKTITFEKIKELSNLTQEKERSIEICIDGGITYDIADDVFDAGATSIAVGSSIWKDEAVREAAEKYLD